MRAGVEEFAEMPARFGNRVGAGDTNAIETEPARFAGELLLEFSGRRPRG